MLGIFDALHPDYQYNIRGWLTKINDPDNCSSTDIFSMGLYYETANTSLGATAQYNGNIAWMEGRTGANCLVNGLTRNKAGYGFTYDNNNRLKKAQYGENTSGTSFNLALNNYTVDLLNYDRDGNLTRVRRKGITSGTTFGYIDNLTINYISSYSSTTQFNWISSISESGTLNKGFIRNSGATTRNYAYDANGNMTTDGHKGVTGNLIYTYNHLNLPVTAIFPGGNSIEWTYDAAGQKLKKRTYNGATTLSEKHYIAGVEYNGTSLEAVYNTEGRVVPNGTTWTYEYTLKDHHACRVASSGQCAGQLPV